MSAFFSFKIPAPALFVIGLAVCVWPACDGSKDKIVQQKVSEAISKLREKKAAECRSLLIQDAEKIVDSLLLAEAQIDFADSLARARPQKPARPMAVPPIDSLQVKPIFEQPKQGG